MLYDSDSLRVSHYITHRFVQHRLEPFYKAHLRQYVLVLFVAVVNDLGPVVFVFIRGARLQQPRLHIIRAHLTIKTKAAACSRLCKNWR